MLPGRRDEENRLSPGQRWAYLSGAVQWYGDLLALIFFVFLLVGAANLALHGDLLLRKLTGFLLAAIPLLVILGLVRAVALLRRGTGASWRDAFGAFVIWQCTSLVVARASVQALYAKEAEFLRTPKTMEEGSFWDAIRGNRGETILGGLGVAGIVAALTNTSGYGGPLTAALLVWPTLAFLAAPYNSRAAQRAALPPELAARRRSERLRMTPKRATVAAGGGLVLAGTVAAVVVALIAPGHHPVVGPQLLPPARGHNVQYDVSPSPSPSTHSPSASPSAAPSSVTSTTPASASASPSPSTSTVPSPSSSPSASPSASTAPSAASTSSSP
jgi:hypothetical protein